MERINKIIVVLLVLGGGILSGCTGVENGSDPGTTVRIITATPRATTPPTATPTPLVPEMDSAQMADVEVVIWYVAEPFLPDPLERLLDTFVVENPFDLPVSPVRFDHPDDLELAMKTALEEGGLPNVVLAFPYQYNAWIETGARFLQLNDYLESSLYGLGVGQIEDIYPVFWDRDVYAGERIAFPGLFYGQTLLYNRTWAQELGYPDPPRSEEQFLLQACTASEINADGTGGWMINTQPGNAAAWLGAFTGGLEGEVGEYGFGLPEVASAFEFLAELRTAECAWGPSGLFAFDSFAQRKGLFYSVSTRDVGAIAAAMEAANNPDTWDMIGFPNHQGETAISVYGRSFLIVESDLPHQIGAWLLLKHLTSTESQVQLAESAGYYPLSLSAAAMLEERGELPLAWVNGLGLLEDAVSEPRAPSWRVMRGVVQDAAAEVLRPGFAPGTLSLVLDQLQELAEELGAGE